MIPPFCYSEFKTINYFRNWCILIYHFWRISIYRLHTALFENVEKGFDKLFGYHRQLSETFEYCNTMKNGSMSDKLKIQETEIVFAGEEKNNPAYQQADIQVSKRESMTDDNTSIRQQVSTSVNQSTNNSVSQSNISDGVSSLFSILPSATDVNPTEEQQQPKPKKKKKRKPGLRQ
jgi:hypothetical protein